MEAAVWDIMEATAMLDVGTKESNKALLCGFIRVDRDVGSITVIRVLELCSGSFSDQNCWLLKRCLVVFEKINSGPKPFGQGNWILEGFSRPVQEVTVNILSNGSSSKKGDVCKQENNFCLPAVQ